jgi:hypothetical protein
VEVRSISTVRPAPGRRLRGLLAAGVLLAALLTALAGSGGSASVAHAEAPLAAVAQAATPTPTPAPAGPNLNQRNKAADAQVAARKLGAGIAAAVLLGAVGTSMRVRHKRRKRKSPNNQTSQSS